MLPRPLLQRLKGSQPHGRPPAQAGGHFFGPASDLLPMSSENNRQRVQPSRFRPAKWLKNRHLQTIFPSLPWSYSKFPALRREILDLPDGDDIAIDWLVQSKEPPATAPLLVILHGLEGSARSSYARMLMIEAADTTPLRAAVAVCVPFNLHLCADALNIGFSKTYQAYLLKRMKRALRRKFNRHTAAFNWQRAMAAKTFAEFDDVVTAPLHGFKNMNNYYDRCSSMHFVSTIERPTLVLNSADDPFMTPDVIPAPDSIAENVTIELSQHGGHVGFISGGMPWHPQYYIPGRVRNFLEPFLARPGL